MSYTIQINEFQRQLICEAMRAHLTGGRFQGRLLPQEAYTQEWGMFGASTTYQAEALTLVEMFEELEKSTDSTMVHGFCL